MTSTAEVSANNDASSATNNGPGLPAAATPTRSKKSSLSKWKAIKVVLFTTGSFVITWVPYFIACVMYVSCDWTATPERCRNIQLAIASPLAILGFANSLTNPIIYAWWHNGFRESAKAIICGAACRKKRRSESDGPSTSATRSGSSAEVPRAAGGRSRTVSDVEGQQQRQKGTRNGNNENSFGLSTTTLDMSTSDLDREHSDVDGGTSDAESALRRRMDTGRPEAQTRTRVNGDTSAVNVCYQPDAKGH